MKHLFVKLFGGTYVDNNGGTYMYAGRIPTWFEIKSYNFRKKRLLKESDRLSRKIKKNHAERQILSVKSDDIIERLQNFK